MTTKFLASVAIVLGLGIAVSADAQYGGYPAAGYTPGTQTSTVPVHPSLQLPATQLQQPPDQSQWPVNRSSPHEFVPQWSGGRPAFASRQSGPPQAHFAEQPRFLPQPYHATSTEAPANGNPRPGNRATGNRPGPEAESLPESLAQPNPRSRQPSIAPAQPNDREHYRAQPSLAAPGGQPRPHYQPPHNTGGQSHYYHPSHGASGEPGYSNRSPRSVGSAFREAVAAPWEGTASVHHGAVGACGPDGCRPAPAPLTYRPVPLRHWFAGADLLFLTTEQSHDRRLLFDASKNVPTLLSTGDVDPDGNVGFDGFLGRYFHGGRHALMVNYFFFDPDRERASIYEPAARLGQICDYRVPMPSWDNISYDVGRDGDKMNDVTVHDWFKNSAAFRARRDVSFQGIEANFVSFGLGGAHRAGLGPQACACGGGCGPQRGCAGPMVAGCNSKVQIRTMHGLRWFQFKDAFDFAASKTDYVYGKTSDDMHYNLDTENNLYGYQFGARVDYPLGCKINVHAGSKFGIFANDAESRSRLGTNDMPAYVNDTYPSLAGDAVVTDESDTVLSTLGELDLGIGYRVNPCWTMRGGYRLYGMTGVATTVGSISDELAHLPIASEVGADDSIILHGGYVGAEYNW